MSLSPSQFPQDPPQERKPKKADEMPTSSGLKKVVPLGPDTDELISYGPKHHKESSAKETGEPVPRWTMRNPKQFGLDLKDA